MADVPPLCRPGLTSDEASNYCDICIEGYFTDPKGSCSVCPSGATCDYDFASEFADRPNATAVRVGIRAGKG